MRCVFGLSTFLELSNRRIPVKSFCGFIEADGLPKIIRRTPEIVEDVFHPEFSIPEGKYSRPSPEEINELLVDFDSAEKSLVAHEETLKTHGYPIPGKV